MSIELVNGSKCVFGHKINEKDLNRLKTKSSKIILPYKLMRINFHLPASQLEAKGSSSFVFLYAPDKYGFTEHVFFYLVQETFKKLCVQQNIPWHESWIGPSTLPVCFGRGNTMDFYGNPSSTFFCFRTKAKEGHLQLSLFGMKETTNVA